jgi:hypothetical protein
MNYAQFIKEIGRGAENPSDLSEADAKQLYGAMLDGGVPELELGAILIALRVKGESLGELLGFTAAVDERLARLAPPAGRPRPGRATSPISRRCWRCCSRASACRCWCTANSPATAVSRPPTFCASLG